MGAGYMHGPPGELRSGRASGVSVLSSPRADASFPRGKGRVRPDQGLYDHGMSGSVTPHASPAGQPLAPEIGPNEPRGPADRWR
jgi:hypothetical protein